LPLAEAMASGVPVMAANYRYVVVVVVVRCSLLLLSPRHRLTSILFVRAAVQQRCWRMRTRLSYRTNSSTCLTVLRCSNDCRLFGIGSPKSKYRVECRSTSGSGGSDEKWAQLRRTEFVAALRNAGESRTVWERPIDHRF
jgi:hypothetical protein